jgi:uncharacterized integral membrane protein
MYECIVENEKIYVSQVTVSNFAWHIDVYQYLNVLLLRKRLLNASSTHVFLNSMRKLLQLQGFSGQIKFCVSVAVVGNMFEDQKVLEFSRIKITVLPFKVRSVGLAEVDCVPSV